MTDSFSSWTQQASLVHAFSPRQRELLTVARVGIAGVGGLGSNCAMLLARCGIQHFVLIDGDTVDVSNLNRQHYFPRHVGMRKVNAMEDVLMNLHKHIHVHKHCLWLTEQNTPNLLREASYWVEGLDDAIAKRLFVEQALQANVFTVSASGIAGFGGPLMQSRQLGDKLVLVGDFTSDIEHFPPLAPRVMQAAAMQADAILSAILNQCCKME